VTVIPIILSLDKTQITIFQGKIAYPVYLTIGNIHKAICRKLSSHAQILVAYVPTSKLKGTTNKAAHCCALANLYHTCMCTFLALIALYGEASVAMASSNGIWQWCHPIFAIFIGDYLEQTLVACTFNRWCPKCTIPAGQLGEHHSYPPCDLNKALDAYGLADGDVHRFHAACKDVDIKAVYKPFWEPLPLVNVYISIIPNILHQLLQSVMKHLSNEASCSFTTTIKYALMQYPPPCPRPSSQ